MDITVFSMETNTATANIQTGLRIQRMDRNGNSHITEIPFREALNRAIEQGQMLDTYI